MEQSFPALNSLGNSEQDTTDVDLEKTTELAPSRWSITTTRIKALLPRYMQPKGLNYNRERLHPTAYLDSLRGYAACSVFMFHMYGYPESGIMYQPIFRLYSAGVAMVDLFFVISGYVLSVRMLKLMRKQQSAQLLDCLASSTFRRYLRLYVPTALASFVTMLMIHVGWCRTHLQKPTLWAQFWDWVDDVGYSSNPFESVKGWWSPEVYRTKFLDQMWTIPVEFRGSIILFAFCTASCKLSTGARMGFCSTVILLCYYWEVMYVACFLAGMLIADCSLSWNPSRQQQKRLPQSHDEKLRTTPGRGLNLAQQGGFIVVFIIGLVLLSQPADFGIDGPFPFQYLVYGIPPNYSDGAEHFWLSIGAIMVIGALEYSPILQKPLTSSFSLYLGELSFGIYAMHNTLVWVVYFGVLAPWKKTNYPESSWLYIPITIIMYLVVLWAADYFTRIDKRIVAFGRWLQKKTFENWEQDLRV